MAYINVNRKNTDQFYRYKMPRLIAKVEGKGNGIKTVIVNMVDIAKALQRPASYPTKFFGCELGAQTQIDLKNERYIVNGAHSADKLQDILDGFIEKFVLCPDCDNPETDLEVDTRKERIGQACKACGHQGVLNMQHRLITFIFKNPPKELETPSKKDKKERRRDKQEKQKGNQNGDTSPTHNPMKVETKEGKFDFSNVHDAAADDDWSVDTSEEAVQRRMEDLSVGIKGMAHHDDLERPEHERFNIFYEFVKAKKVSGSIESSAKEIVAEAERLDVKDKAVLALAELLFDKNILSQIKKNRVLFLRFVNENRKAQKFLLGAFEMLVGKSFPAELLPKAAHILKAFYDNDLMEEEVILQWGEKVSKKYVDKEMSNQIHEKVRPFVRWLKEAEEEESSEDEEDEVEVVYDNKAQQLKAEVAKADDNEDDLDIDAI